jgi:hypothetical protein
MITVEESFAVACNQQFDDEPLSIDLDTRDHQIRVNAALVESSHTVLTHFGRSVGSCWGDFYCTNNRIRGRLYATSNAILFYTNLLGFERRLCLLLKEVEDIRLFKTTSISIRTVDNETYIFKSFNNREQVLHLIKALQSLEQKQLRREHHSEPPLRSTLNHPEPPEEALQPNNTKTAPRIPSASVLRQTISSTLPASFGSPPPPICHSNRRRSVSDSIVRIPGINPLHSTEQDTPLPIGSIECQKNKSNAETWEAAKAHPGLQEKGIEAVEVSCSLEQFYEFFLADNAEHSLDRYQRDHVKDKDVQCAGWDADCDGAWSRTITFSHPVKTTLGVGPSAAKTSRKQRIRRFPKLGIVLENWTNVGGVPAADSFFVQDRWIIESLDSERVRLSTWYKIQFTKRTVLKTFIQKSIHKETKQWLSGYVKMLKNVFQENEPTRTIPAAMAYTSISVFESATINVLKDIKYSFRVLMLVAVFIVGFGLVAVIVQLASMHRIVLELQAQLNLLILEQ